MRSERVGDPHRQAAEGGFTKNYHWYGVLGIDDSNKVIILWTIENLK